MEVIQTAITFNAGLPLMGLWLPAGLVFSILLIVLLAWRSYLMIKADGKASRAFTIVLSLAFAPVALLFFISQLWPVYVIRGLLASGAVYLLWIALVLTGPNIKFFDRGVIYSVVVVLFAIGLVNHYQYLGFPYAPFPEINDYIESNLDDSGIVVHSNKITMLPAYYYNPGLPHTFLPDPPESGSDTLALATQEVIGIRAESDIEAAVSDHSQIFFVLFTREIQEYEQSGIETHPVLAYLESHYDEVALESFGDVGIYEFREPGR